MGGKADEDECPPEPRSKTVFSHHNDFEVKRTSLEGATSTLKILKKTNWLILSIQWFGGFAVLNFVTPSFTECAERMGSTILLLEIQAPDILKVPDWHVVAARIHCPSSPQ